MNTPIVDFVRSYADKNISRCHMPGHKGRDILGFEKYDITEISGADVLSGADGIIKKSEDNASLLFDSAHTFYSTQGSTVAIYAMIALLKKDAFHRPRILAARNAHRAFVQGCAHADARVDWIFPGEANSIISFGVTPEQVERAISESADGYDALYLTSPDYLGFIQDIGAIADVCRKYDVPLLVDNAHGAYLKFLPESLHPLDLGATLCCDSAHKTLPALTGGAYLHVSKNAPRRFLSLARDAMTLFSSTSPSYLTLQSLDMCNLYMSDGFPEKLSGCICRVEKLKSYISSLGFDVVKSEPLKVVVDASSVGISGDKLSDILRNDGVESEFSDEDYLVLMLTAFNDEKDFEKIAKAFSKVEIRGKRQKPCFALKNIESVMSLRDAVFSPCEIVKVRESLGRICAMPTVNCPPAVPIAVCGEVITEEMIRIFEYYHINSVKVLNETI